MKFAIGSMTVGEVLDRALKILLARFPVFFIINVICQGPQVIAQAAQPIVLDRLNQRTGAADSGQAALAVVGVWLFVLVLQVVFLQIGTAATLRVVMDEYANQPVSVGGAFRFAFSRLVPLVGTSLLAGLVVALGFCACIAPGVYFFVSYLFASQIVALENKSGQSALKRSQNLISGYRGRVFGTFLLLLIVFYLMMFAGGAAAAALFPITETVQQRFGNQMITMNRVIPERQALLVLALSPLSILMQTYMAVVVTLLYLDTRIRKEGFDLELAATVSGPESATQ